MNVEGKDVSLDAAAPHTLSFADRWLLGQLQQADMARVDATADARMAHFKDVVNACRTLRGHMGLSPAQKVPLIAAGDAAIVGYFAPYLVPLLKLVDAQIVPELPASDTPVLIVGDFRLLLHVAVDKGRPNGRECAAIPRSTRMRSPRRKASSPTRASSPARRSPWMASASGKH